jgi:hypothetical protein
VSVHQVGFNFDLYKMHGEYNIKYMEEGYFVFISPIKQIWIQYLE